MTAPDWHLWRAFLAVSRGGSLSAAARSLDLTQPTLGRQIAALESTLGVPLFTRSTEGLRPTDRALSLLPHAEAMAAAAASLLRAASGADDALRGTVRLAASEAMGGLVLPPMLARFRNANPGIDIELSLSDRNEDILRHDADLAVRNTTPTQGALVSRRIGEVPVRLFAHGDYVRRHGLPATVHELSRHTLIGREEHVHRIQHVLGVGHQFGLRCNNELGLLEALRAGYGIGYCQEPLGRRHPELVAVLPDLVLAQVGIWLVVHEDLRTLRRIRSLFDYLACELTDYVGSVSRRAGAGSGDGCVADVASPVIAVGGTSG